LNVYQTKQEPLRVDHERITRLVQALFQAAGLNEERAESVARLLVMTDMIGRPTHGLTQTKAYLDALAAGTMGKDENIEVVRDTGSTMVWDGNYLPGLWLVEKAIETAVQRIHQHGVVTVAIRKSHHIGCLASLIKQAVDQGYFVTLASSGPHGKYAAPFGGTRSLLSPNPIAWGIPARRDPILVDMTATITTVSMTREKAKAGQLFDHPWLIDHKGQPTRDPRVMEMSDPPGSMMWLGGMESGHKGFGLALMVDALTQALCGHGRKDAPTRWGAGVFLQLMDPAAFAGRDAFCDQVDHLIDACHNNPPTNPEAPVRLPGELVNRRISESRANGVPLSIQTLEQLQQAAKTLGVPDNEPEMTVYGNNPA